VRRRLRRPSRGRARLRVRAAALPAAALLCAALAAAPAGAQSPTPPPRAAPLSARAELVLEPPRLAVGDVAVLERIVVTPPGFGLGAAPPATPPEGLWLLGSESLPVEREAQRWVHRTRLRIRARDVGTFAWPPSELTLESEDGRRDSVSVPGRLIDVVSVLSEVEARETPFGLRGLPGAAAPRGGVLVPAVAGSLFTLALLGLLLLVRRERRRRAEAEALGAAAGVAAEPGPPPDVEAAEAFAAAAAEPDARRAADRLSLALRGYVSRRFHVPARSATTPELAAARPAFAAEARWDALLAMLEQLDAVRFRPPADSDREAVQRALEEARAFVGGAAKGPA